MLYWAVSFFVVAVVAALLGFGGIAEVSAGIARFLFILFLILFVISLVVGMMRGRRSRVGDGPARTAREG